MKKEANTSGKINRFVRCIILAEVRDISFNLKTGLISRQFLTFYLFNNKDMDIPLVVLEICLVDLAAQHNYRTTQWPQ